MTSLKAKAASYVDRVRALALRVSYREPNLNQAQLCVIPIPSKPTSHAAPGRTI
jgi:hypothetical protein